MEHPYNIISWNVDGYDVPIHHWIQRRLDEYQPDVLFLTETKMKPEILDSYLSQFSNYNYIINAHVPARYHGVAMLIHKRCNYAELEVHMNIECRKDTRDCEAGCGRLIVVLLDNKYIIVGTYVPNSGIDSKDTTKLEYRIHQWDPALISILEQCQASRPVIWIGDINVAPYDIDVSDPNKMQHMAGFRPQERQNIQILFNAGWCDAWRYKHPNEIMYTWRGHHRRDNYGLRLDNMIVSSNLIDKIVNAYIIETILSDHVPTGLILAK